MLTLGDFYRTGQQDCANAISIDEFDTAIAPRESVMAWAVENLSESAEWIESQDGEFDGLDPVKCWESWRAGWIERAIVIVAEFRDSLSMEAV
jgi:hypothetical protein